LTSSPKTSQIFLLRRNSQSFQTFHFKKIISNSFLARLQKLLCKTNWRFVLLSAFNYLQEKRAKNFESTTSAKNEFSLQEIVVVIYSFGLQYHI
jgi:hypothetical protein